MGDFGDCGIEWERADEGLGVHCEHDDWNVEKAQKDIDPRDDIDYNNLNHLMRKGYHCSDKTLNKLVAKMRAGYAHNRKALVGSENQCPTCGKMFVKRTYHHVFCGTRGHGGKFGKGQLCKDRYWNFVDLNRRFRASLYK